MGKREENNRERRQELISAAIKLISQKGYADTSVSDITAECGMSVGNFYHYFKSKDEIVAAAELDPASKELEKLIRNKKLNATEKLREYLHFYANSDRKLYGINFRKSWLSHLISDSETGSENRIDKRKNDIIRLISCGIESGEFSKDIPAGEIAEEMVFTLYGACMYFAMKGSTFALTEWMDNHFEKIEHCLMKPYMLETQ